MQLEFCVLKNHPLKRRNFEYQKPLNVVLINKLYHPSSMGGF